MLKEDYEQKQSECQFSLFQCIGGVITSKKDVVDEVSQSLPLKLAAKAYILFAVTLFVMGVVGQYIMYLSYRYISPEILLQYKDVDMGGVPLSAYLLMGPTSFLEALSIWSVVTSILVVIGLWMLYCIVSYLFSLMFGGTSTFSQHFILFAFISPFLLLFGAVYLLFLWFIWKIQIWVIFAAAILALVGAIYLLKILTKGIMHMHKISGAKAFFVVVLSAALFSLIGWVIAKLIISMVLFV